MKGRKVFYGGRGGGKSQQARIIREFQIRSASLMSDGSIGIEGLATLTTEEESQMVHKLGSKAKDKVTGLEGILVSRVEHLTGCDRYCLAPASKDGKPGDESWFDVDRIEVIDAGLNTSDAITG